MATKFLEPGGDATFNVATTAGGFWVQVTVSGTGLDNVIVHGSHINSIIGSTSGITTARTPNGTCADAGTCISFYLYVSTLPDANSTILSITKTNTLVVLQIKITSVGILKLFEATNQIGTDGTTLSTGQWYRISLAYTITSTTVNRFELFVDAVSSISITNATITNIVSNRVAFGNVSANGSFDSRFSDIYIDNSSSLTDPGDIWVTAKRPNANGTTNGFTTQIGAGGSGYGSGHSPQVNERALSNTNGWSMIGAGSAVTEEYNIESKSTGDIDISTATIVDWLGWVDIKSLAGETINIILNGANTAQAITSTETLYTAIKGSATYPAGTGADIGVITDTSLTTVSLYECGVMVAYIPKAPNPQNTSSALFDFMGPAQGYHNA